MVTKKTRGGGQISKSFKKMGDSEGKMQLPSSGPRWGIMGQNRGGAESGFHFQIYIKIGGAGPSIKGETGWISGWVFFQKLGEGDPRKGKGLRLKTGEKAFQIPGFLWGKNALSRVKKSQKILFIGVRMGAFLPPWGTSKERNLMEMGWWG